MYHINGIIKRPLEFYLPMPSTCRFPVFKPLDLSYKLSPATLGISMKTESMGRSKAF